jgi:hypothetical protein
MFRDSPAFLRAAQQYLAKVVGVGNNDSSESVEDDRKEV